MSCTISLSASAVLFECTSIRSLVRGVGVEGSVGIERGHFQTGRRGRPPGPRGDSRSACPVEVSGARPGQSRPSAAPCPPPPRSAASVQLQPRGPLPPVPSHQILVSTSN